MKTNVLKRTSAVLAAMLLLLQGTGTLPVRTGHSPAGLTASAAEEDYPWTTYLKKSADWFGTSEAITIADECIQYQVSGEGGWQKGMKTAHTGDWAHSTIDNDATTSQIRFLMRTYAQTKQQKYLDCAMRGVDCLFKMQYSNGGFMQCLNTPGTYHAHITLNDGAYVHVLSILKEMRGKTGDFTNISDAYSQKAAQSFEKAIQCLLDMQIIYNGKKTAWCQQHDENTLAPAAARAYELPSVCTSESAGVVQFLYQEAKDTGRADLADSVNSAITWFQDVTLHGIKFVTQGDDKVVVQDPNADPLWARFYDLNKMVPLFSDRDSSVHYDVSEISKERRTGYSWYGNWGKNVVNLSLLTGEPAEEPEYHGELISKLVVHDLANGANWSIEQNLGVGSKIYGDRDYTLAAQGNSSTVSGVEYIRTACNSKSYSGNLAELTAGKDLKLYIMMDVRVVNYMAEQGIQTSWLDDYTHMRTQVFSSNGEEYTVFVRELKAGETVTLGSNFTANNSVNYFAAVFPAQPEVTTTTTETTTTTTATTTTTTATTTTTTGTTYGTGLVPMLKVKGDVDENGTVDIRDGVLLARIVGDEDRLEVSDQAKLNAQINNDGKIDSDDLSILMRFFARIIKELPD
ncbi:MAG: pectate lyase [Oscillospiraceae bacterium]|nr:pectate lyase [Oscillospiraceae bacterium]